MMLEQAQSAQIMQASGRIPPTDGQTVVHATPRTIRRSAKGILWESYER